MRQDAMRHEVLEAERARRVAAVLGITPEESRRLHDVQERVMAPGSDEPARIAGACGTTLEQLRDYRRAEVRVGRL